MNLIYYPTREYHEELLKKYEYYYHNKYSVENFSVSINILDSNIYKNLYSCKKITLKIDEHLQNVFTKFIKVKSDEYIGTFVKTYCNLSKLTQIIEKFLSNNMSSCKNIIGTADGLKKIKKLATVFKREHCKIHDCNCCKLNGCVDSELDSELDSDLDSKSKLILEEFKNHLYCQLILADKYLDQDENLLLVNMDEIFIIHNKLGIIFSNNSGFGILNYPNFIQKNKIGSYITGNINFHDKIFTQNTIEYDCIKKFSSKINIRVDSNLNSIMSSIVKNHLTNKSEYFNEIEFSNKNMIGKYKFDNFESEEYFYPKLSKRIYKTSYTWIESCPKDSGSTGSAGTSGSTGLRFRGTYKSVENTSNGSITDLTLKLNGTEEYVKKNNVVLLDNTKTNLKTNKLIGWKAAKDSASNPVIIKLEIEPDATIVRPIDPEYYFNHKKERCNKAKVIDIQKIIFSKPDEEFSIVNTCDEAFSYVFEKNAGFTYKLGSIVEPDCFDNDVNKGCANGIHFFQSRNALFQTYLKEFQQKHIKQD